MKNILLFGAGKSATILIDYLIAGAPKNRWHLTVVDRDLELVKSKTGRSFQATPAAFDVLDDEARKSYIGNTDLVISLLPPSLHQIIAKECLAQGKNLLTASYVDEATRKMEPEIRSKGLLFMYEMGLDPGIDHMSAMRLIDSIQGKGGLVRSFRSFCGGLPDPGKNDNPWHYKVSWNPRNVVLAGKSGAVYKEKGRIHHLMYEEIFEQNKTVQVPGLGKLAYYPNRDSLEYISLYKLEEAETFLRATLRFPDFCEGWNVLVRLGLTDENHRMETTGLTYFNWMSQKLTLNPRATNEENLVTYLQVRENSKVMRQLKYLGMLNGDLINKGRKSNADILQHILENKLAMDSDDRDLVVMQHEIEFERRNILTTLVSTLVSIGENSQKTAMAKTVGLPLGILAKQILTGKLLLKGLHIPIRSDVYLPVLRELEDHGIRFEESFY